MGNEGDSKKKKQLWAKAMEQSHVTRKPDNSLDGLPWKSKVDVLYDELKVEEKYQKAVEEEQAGDQVRKPRP